MRPTTKRGRAIEASTHLLVSVADTLKRTRTALRRLAIVQVHRMAPGGMTVPTGYHCKVCGSEWSLDKPEDHAPDCVAQPAKGE